MSDWKPLLGRVTILLAPSPKTVPSAQDLYKKVWGSDPLSFQAAQNPLMPSVAQGTQAGLALNSSVHPTRIDLTISAAGSQDPWAPPRLVRIENGEQLRDQLATIATLVGKADFLTNPVARVAVFLQVVSIENDSASVNKALLLTMPADYRLTLRDEEQFVLQVNRAKKSSSAENLKLNRITRWSEERFQHVSFNVAMAPGQIVASRPNMQPEITEIVTASITFDFNTEAIAMDKHLSAAQQSSLLSEALGQVGESLKECGLKFGFGNEQTLH